MNKQTLININQILERDSKTTTYKFALLRSVIDVTQEKNPDIRLSDGLVYLKIGSVIEKWILYYYPLFKANLGSAQINGINTSLAIARFIEPIVKFYECNGGLSALFQDLRKNGVPAIKHNDFWALCKKLNEVITTMPMQYIGQSVHKTHYSIFKFNSPKRISKPTNITSLSLIQAFGEFSIPEDYFDVFEFMGGFISGSNSIIFKWADFSVNQINGVNYETIVNELTTTPVLQRNVLYSKNFYDKLFESQGYLECVWSGQKFTKATDNNIDHVIPFAIWHNNDLWNLLPTHKKTNKEKSDKIPTAAHIMSRKDIIIHYWEMLNREFDKSFLNEMKISILGTGKSDNWEIEGINKLISVSDYLITTRGFEPYLPK